MTERFSASVAARIMHCPASANLELAIPGWAEPVEDRTKDNAANRGTNMHEKFAKIMDESPADMRRLAEAISYVAEISKRRRFKRMVEETITATWLVSQPKTTPDLVLYVKDEIHLFDLKTGRIEVDVIDNAQLLFGAVCVAPLAPDAKGVYLHILQPWANGCEEWYADTTVIQEFMDKAIEAERKIMAKDLTFGPSDECKFCPANPHSRGQKGKPFCPAMMAIHYPPYVDEDAVLSL